MNYLLNNPLNATDPTGYMRRRPNNRERGKDPTGGGVNWDYFEFVPSIFDQIDESVKRRASKYSALTYEELQELKKRDKEEADKAKQAKENANKKDDKSGKYNPDGKIFNFHFMGGMMNDGPDNLIYPQSINLHGKDVIENLLGWARFIVKYDLRDISIGRIIDFTSLKNSDKSYGVRYSGTLEYGGGWATWSTQGLTKIQHRKLIMGVDPIAMPDGNGGHKGYSFVFEGYPIYGNTNFVNLFEIVFDSYETFKTAFKSVYGNTDFYIIEGR
jgi:hypothetical protein